MNAEFCTVQLVLLRFAWKWLFKIINIAVRKSWPSFAALGTKKQYITVSIYFLQYIKSYLLIKFLKLSESLRLWMPFHVLAPKDKKKIKITLYIQTHDGLNLNEALRHWITSQTSRDKATAHCFGVSITVPIHTELFISHMFEICSHK